MNHLPQAPENTLGSFQIFSSQGAPPVSTTLAANFATSSACVVDTIGKFATGVNDTGRIFAAGVNDAGCKL